MATPKRLIPLRLAVGGTLAIHGFAKLFGGPGKRVPEWAARYLGQEYQEWFENGGVDRLAIELQEADPDAGGPDPRLFAYLSACTEFFGGALFALGIGTRLTGLALAAQLAASIQRIHRRRGMVGPDGWELPALLLIGTLTVVMYEE
jgi:uncharacterized membrane protein YphA (DoxX/SURF4 family)